MSETTDITLAIDKLFDRLDVPVTHVMEILQQRIMVSSGMIIAVCAILEIIGAIACLTLYNKYKEDGDQDWVNPGVPMIMAVMFAIFMCCLVGITDYFTAEAVAYKQLLGG